MEQQKIGKFIHDLRKEKEMTQKQLADMVGVSDKAISKWETGRGIPDTAIMSELCKVLGISINELLSGERLSVNNYNGKAEENMVNLLRDKEQEIQKWSKVKVTLNLLWLLLFIFMIFILGMGQPDIRWFLDMPSLCLNIGFLILGLIVTYFTPANERKIILAVVIAITIVLVYFCIFPVSSQIWADKLGWLNSLMGIT